MRGVSWIARDVVLLDDTAAMADDDFNLPDGFSVEPPKLRLPQGFSTQAPQMQGAPVNQTDWRGMLDSFAQAQQQPDADPLDDVEEMADPLDDVEGGTWHSGPRGADLYEAPQSLPPGRFGQALPPGQRPPIDPNEMMRNKGIQTPRSEDDEDLEVDSNVRDPFYEQERLTPPEMRRAQYVPRRGELGGPSPPQPPQGMEGQQSTPGRAFQDEGVPPGSTLDPGPFTNDRGNLQDMDRQGIRERRADKPLWQTAFDELVGVKSAEARGARKPSPSQALPAQPGDPPGGTMQQQPDGSMKMWDLDTRTWIDQKAQTPPPDKPAAAKPSKPSKGEPKEPVPPGWFERTVDWVNRKGGEAKEGFQRRIEQAEQQAGPDASFRERAQAYNKAFDPQLQKGIESGPQPSVGEGIKQTFGESYDQMKNHYQYLLDNISNKNNDPLWYRSLAGLGNAAMVGLGPVGMGLSPIQGTYRAIVTQPMENAMGLPKWVTEPAMMLATPGIGIGPAAKLGPQTSGAIGWTTRQAGNVLQQAPGIKQAKTITQSLFFPQSMAGGKEFVDSWQAATGLAAQENAKVFDAAKKFYPELINAPRDFGPTGAPTLRDPQVNFMNYIDGGPSATRPAGNLGVLADGLKPAFEQVKQDAKSVDRWAEQQWRDEYFPHYWEDPNAARAALAKGSGGAAGHLKERVYNYVEDGINAGLKPKYEPIEMAMRYLTDMRHMIAQEKVLQAGRDAGMVTDKMGPGMVRMNNLGPGREFYAPEGFGHAWNNHTSRGIAALGEQFGNMADYMRRYTNFSTQMMMGFLNNWHAMTIGEAGWSTEAARAMNSIWADRGVENIKGLARLMAAPTASIRYAIKGKMFNDAVLAKDTFWSRHLSPETVQMLHDLGPQAGLRWGGTRHATDWSSSRMGDMWTRFRRSAETFHIPGTGPDEKLGGPSLSFFTPKGIMQGIDYATPIVGTGSEFGGALSRGFKGTSAKQIPGMLARTVVSDIAGSMQATQHWLMEKMVPLVKSGVQGEHMQDFLRANPNATKEQVLRAFQDIGTFTDSRFGEAVQDNIHWNNVPKQFAQMFMVSYSWNRGVVNVIGGGVNDQINRQMGKGGSPSWTPKDHYLTMTLLNTAIMNSVYQKLKTGEWPNDMRDLLGGKTGGTKYEQQMNDKGTALGQWKPMPERIQMPGIFPKEFAGAVENGFGELWMKANPGVHSLYDLAKIKKDSQWFGNAINSVVNNMTPIQMQTRTDYPGTAFGPAERAMSASPAKPLIANPQYERIHQMYEKFPALTPERIPQIKEGQRIRNEYIKAHPGSEGFTTAQAKKWWKEKQEKGKGYGGANP